MKKLVFSLFFIAILLSATAQESGIRFFHGSWDEAVTLAKKEKKKIFIDFFTEWCGPCRMISPIIDELAGEYEGRAVIGKCDVDNNDDIVGKFMVRNIPTIVFIKGGQVVDKQVGACTKADLVKKLEKLL